MSDSTERDVSNHITQLIDSGAIDPHEYAGYTTTDPKKVCTVSFQDKSYCVVFVMTEKSNGDYDGCGGFNHVEVEGGLM